MRAGVEGLIKSAVEAVRNEGLLSAEKLPDIIVEKPKKPEFGDFSTNIAMLLAPIEKKKPRDIASAVAAKISGQPNVEKCEIAGPGFINIFLKPSFWTELLSTVLEKGERFGESGLGKGKKIQVEFVSANPTGPLHIGHGRGAAVGDSLSRILKEAGFDVTREFYINDMGRQIETLGRSIYTRYLQLHGREAILPEDAYKGEYIKDVAKAFIEKHGDKHLSSPENEAIKDFMEFGKDALLELIKKDLADFGVAFDVWYSERSLYSKDLVQKTIDDLRGKGHIFEEEGALWFRTTAFGDDKDRVLKKADGSMTYFASDIAYHREKVERGFNTIVDIWGADHHGYQPRVAALFKALGLDEAAFKVIFIQLVALLRNGVPVPMGKREGEFVTLKQVMDEVGTDACRFFFLMRKADAQLDFDLELAKSQAPENPVYYVQYCHARIQSIFEFAKEKGFGVPEKYGPEILEKLSLKEEADIIKHLGSFADLVEKSAIAMEPHKVTFYLIELAGLFHPYYNRNRIVTDDAGLTSARLLLCRAVQIVSAKGLSLLGVSAPLKM